MTIKTRTRAKKKKDTNVTTFSIEEMVQTNSIDILLIKKDITEIKTNHLSHIEADIKKIDKKVEKIDFRLWSIMVLIVMSAGANYLL